MLDQGYQHHLQELLEQQSYQQAFEYSHASEKPFVARLYGDSLLESTPIEASKVYVESDYPIELVCMKYLDRLYQDKLSTDGNVKSAAERKQEQALYKQGLLEFLVQICKYLNRPDQIIMIEAWILELLLCELDSVSLNSDEKVRAVKFQQVCKHLEKKKLPFKLVDSMTRNHLQIDVLLYYCKLLSKNKEMIDIHLSKRGYQAALYVLGSQNDASLYYEYSGELVEHIPNDVVKLWMKCKFLEPKKLVHAMLKLGNNKVLIEYLEICIYQGGCREKVVGNLLLKIYLETKQEEKVLEFLEFLKQGCFMDLVILCRTLEESEMIFARVECFCMMKMYELAVELALNKNNIDLAESTLSKIEGTIVESESELNPLWIRIIKHALKTQPTPELYLKLK